MIIFNSCSCSHLCSLNEADRSHTESAMSKSIVSIALANIELEPGSIPQEWVLSGNPETRSKVLVRSHDWIANLVVWECGAVSYKWHYNQDEAYLVLSGEGFVTDDKGVERRFGPGDVAYFPAGTNTTWRHPDHFKKIAFLKETVFRPVGLGLKVWNKLLRMVGLKDKLAILFAVAAMTLRNSR
ncbi:MAG: hypothetical protein DMG36_14350 [Acidobacteria bacterium]|nr:MAG: hypothetical protein DMG36_14350 [Acidobacteriota bacterium]